RGGRRRRAVTTPAPAPATPLAPGFEHTERYTSVEQEYAAIRGAAALQDRSARFRILFAGAQPAETLTGLLTNDVLALRPGTGHYAAALTAKGKIIADVRVFARADDFLVDAPEAAGPGFAVMLRKFVNPRLTKFVDVSTVMRTIGVFGPRARAVLARVFAAEGATLASLPPYHHVTLALDGTRVLAVSAPDLGLEGFDLFVPVEAALALWSRLLREGAVPAGSAAADIARVEAGRPLWGTDMDDSTLAAEANLDALGGISFTKGCYTGQETVARVHFRGHVNRALRGVMSAVPMPRGAQLHGPDGQPCGGVRSSVVSPRLGPIAIAMLRREVPSGSEVPARWDGGECVARVCELPFG
ncbi:MAG TPA: glycine cleavage T C-terminal barrel domain-containing protein, partial [Gemmatimonadaceae bacterium]|nr:glycine cleavage T C-terminal barrel domain-containing protein [Gemmatimonadaceae bacterium]